LRLRPMMLAGVSADLNCLVLRGFFKGSLAPQASLDAAYGDSLLFRRGGLL
jgi:hypothetical protein